MYDGNDGGDAADHLDSLKKFDWSFKKNWLVEFKNFNTSTQQRLFLFFFFNWTIWRKRVLAANAFYSQRFVRDLVVHVSLNGCNFRCLLLENFEVLQRKKSKVFFRNIRLFRSTSNEIRLVAAFNKARSGWGGEMHSEVDIFRTYLWLVVCLWEIMHNKSTVWWCWMNSGDTPLISGITIKTQQNKWNESNGMNKLADWFRRNFTEYATKKTAAIFHISQTIVLYHLTAS